MPDGFSPYSVRIVLAPLSVICSMCSSCKTVSRSTMTLLRSMGLPRPYPRRRNPRPTSSTRAASIRPTAFQIGLVTFTSSARSILFRGSADPPRNRWPQRGRDGKLLLTVDVGIHHVVDVRCKFDPRTLERNDTRRIEFRTVGMHALSKKTPGRRCSCDTMTRSAPLMTRNVPRSVI